MTDIQYLTDYVYGKLEEMIYPNPPCWRTVDKTTFHEIAQIKSSPDFPEPFKKGFCDGRYIRTYKKRFATVDDYLRYCRKQADGELEINGFDICGPYGLGLSIGLQGSKPHIKHLERIG